jgi:hypothetical protein
MQDRTVTGLPEQDCRDRTARTGLPRQDCKVRNARTGRQGDYQEMTARIGLPGQNVRKELLDYTTVK